MKIAFPKVLSRRNVHKQICDFFFNDDFKNKIKLMWKNRLKSD